MIPSQTLRELGASTRVFHSVKQAVLWYRREQDSRLRVNREMQFGVAPRCREKIDETNATYAAIANCLKAVHPTDPNDEDEAAGVRYRVSGEMLLWLVHWYEGDGWGDGTWLAEKAGISKWKFTTRCKKTERVLHTRMAHAGLLSED